jgi:hypothetical protein
MSLLEVTKNFTANRFDNSCESCHAQVQQGYAIDTEEFVVGQLSLDDYDRTHIETSDGKRFIRFKYQQSSFWVELSTFDGSTEVLPPQPPSPTFP